MKNQTGIWITFKEALLINLEDQQEVNAIHISSDIENCQGEQAGSFGDDLGDAAVAQSMPQYIREIREWSFYNNIIADLDDRAELYIFGPEEAKYQLEKALLENDRFAGNIVAVESAQEMNAQQKISKVKQFFKSRFVLI